MTEISSSNEAKPTGTRVAEAARQAAEAAYMRYMEREGGSDDDKKADKEDYDILDKHLTPIARVHAKHTFKKMAPKGFFEIHALGDFIDEAVEKCLYKICRQKHEMKLKQGRWDKKKNANIETWFKTNVRNKCSDQLRDAKRKQIPIQSRSTEGGEVQRDDDYFATGKEAESPEEFAIKREELERKEEEKQRLRLAIQKLPPTYREVIELEFEMYRGSPVIKKKGDIAKQLGISPSALSNRLSRAKQTLRQQLADRFDDDGVDDTSSTGKT
ncbi:sigma-70 family RNA polymerase sigma factor [bacterium]|nr:sigma-70 family RNA polymerase sigma factor [bacterium]